MYDGDLQYLRRGSETQKAALSCLRSLDIMQILLPYKPVLCGTIPLNIHIPGSDLDIICEVADFPGFEQHLIDYFADYPDFSLTYSNSYSGRVLTATFTDVFPLEIFGQAVPVKQQHAFRHMIQESRVLSLADEAFRLKVVNLKKTGLSTEAAFTKLLQLTGDPYKAVLSLESMTDEQISLLLPESGSY
jgi:hypothetical protein